MIRNTLAALALSAATIQPAAANDDLVKVLFGVMVGAAIVDAARNTPAPVDPAAYVNRRVEAAEVERQLQQRRDRTTVCWWEDRFDATGRVARYEYNCRNQLIRAYYPY